jgi:cytochrome c oxidase subunit 4
MSLPRLIAVWIALMLLLSATIAASFLPIGNWRQLINLAIAAAKAGLILWFFMELRSETALVRLIAGSAGALLFIFAVMLTADYSLRPAAFVSALH